MTEKATRLRREQANDLHRRVQGFARHFGAIPEHREGRTAFDELARAIAAFQCEHQPQFAALIRHALGSPRELESTPIERWPAVTVEAFRMARIATFPESEQVACFHTSGTTSQLVGQHPARRLDTYSQLSVAAGRAALLDTDSNARVVALAPPPSQAQHSSLGFMMREFMRHFERNDAASHESKGDQPCLALDDPRRWLLRSTGVDETALREVADAAHAADTPVMLLATSFALVLLFDQLGAPIELPSGSVVMTTGGFKGRTRSVAPDWLAGQIQTKLGVARERIVAEYGMTELSSQLYAGGIGTLKSPANRFVPPPWLRIVAVSPESFEPLPQGNVGLAQFIDLANIDTALSVVTQDLIVIHDDGVELLGRRPTAPLRGCSLGVEAFVAPTTLARGAAPREPTPCTPAREPSRVVPDCSFEPLARVRRLLDGASRMADAHDPLGRRIREELCASGDLSPEGVELALTECLETRASEAELAELCRAVPTCSVAHVILSANVFVAPLRAIALGLVATDRVLVKPSRRSPVFTRLLHEACPDLFQLCERVEAQPRDHVWAYGSDETLDTIAGELPAGVVLHRHGFGIGIALVDAAQPGELESTADELCRDVVPFDQRGCLSPRIVFALGSSADHLRWNGALEVALTRWQRRVPLGALNPTELAERAWYRRTLTCTGEMRGALGGEFGVERSARALLVPPAVRCLHQVCLPRSEAHEALHRIRANQELTTWVTCVGASSTALREAAAEAFPAARVTPLGRMQRPPLDGPVDRRAPTNGQLL